MLFLTYIAKSIVFSISKSILTSKLKTWFILMSVLIWTIWFESKPKSISFLILTPQLESKSISKSKSQVISFLISAIELESKSNHKPFQHSPPKEKQQKEKRYPLTSGGGVYWFFNEKRPPHKFWGVNQWFCWKRDLLLWRGSKKWTKK